MNRKIALSAAMLGILGCNADPCQTYAITVHQCPGQVDINSTSSSSTGSGMPTITCSDKQENVAKCLLDSGVDPCKIAVHPEMLTGDEQRKVEACKAGL